MGVAPAQIPVELMRADYKPLVIVWIALTSLPSRFRRKMLQEWGAQVGAEITGEDYARVVAPRA